MHLPSKEIPVEIRESNLLFTAIVDWLDQIHLNYVFPEIDKLYNFTDYRRIDDKWLDNLLYDKGFSTSKSLTPEMKRCILEDWSYIIKMRLTPKGLEKYLSCMLGPSTKIHFIKAKLKNFIQPGSTKFGFGNQSMLNTVYLNTDFMTYIYHPSYQINTYLHIFYQKPNPDITAELLQYLKTLVPLELPIVGIAVKWNIFFYEDLNIKVGTILNITTGIGTLFTVWFNGFQFIGINNIALKILSIDSDTQITLDYPLWLPSTFYTHNSEIMGPDGAIYEINYDYFSDPLLFTNDVTNGNLILKVNAVDIQLGQNLQKPDPLIP